MATYRDGVTNRTLPTNALAAVPFPAKTVSNSSVVTSTSLHTAPVTDACGAALRLTASSSALTGSAWYPRQMNVREGFETVFGFRVSNPSTFCARMDDVQTNCRSRGGEGFAFVVQNDHDLVVGQGGMELGYGALQDALSVEFDTWFNYDQEDAYENQISVHAGGRGQPTQANHTQSLGWTTAIPDLTDGDHTVKITYDPNMPPTAYALLPPSRCRTGLADWYTHGMADHSWSISWRRRTLATSFRRATGARASACSPCTWTTS